MVCKFKCLGLSTDENYSNCAYSVDEYSDSGIASKHTSVTIDLQLKNFFIKFDFTLYISFLYKYKSEERIMAVRNGWPLEGKGICEQSP